MAAVVTYDSNFIKESVFDNPHIGKLAVNVTLFDSSLKPHTREFTMATLAPQEGDQNNIKADMLDKEYK
jgi:hydrogenase maturation factor